MTSHYWYDYRRPEAETKRYRDTYLKLKQHEEHIRVPAALEISTALQLSVSQQARVRGHPTVQFGAFLFGGP